MLFRNLHKFAASRRTAIAALALAAIGALYFFMITRSTLWDRDEPRFASAAIAMTRTGDYLVPKFNEQLRPDKPILIYWLMSATLKIFGNNEFAVRFWAPVGVLATALMLFMVGRRFLSPGVALAAAAMLLLTPLALCEGTLATVDAVLLAFITAAIALIVTAPASGLTAGKIALLGLLLGLAQLTKGPVGLAVPVLSGIVFFVMLRRERNLRRGLLHLGIASAIGIAIFLIWAIPANAATGGEFLRRGIGEHVLARSASAREGHGGNFFAFLPFYLPVILVGFAPWVVWLPGAIAMLVRTPPKEPRVRAALWAWIVPTFILMTLAATKLPHYIMPIWPGLALLTAWAMDARIRGRTDPAANAWFGWGAKTVLGIGLVAALAIGIVPHFMEVSAGRTAYIVTSVAAILFMGAALAYWALLRGNDARAAITLAAAALVAVAFGGVVLLPAVEQYKLSPRIAQAIRRQCPNGPVYTSGYNEPTLNFYISQPSVEHLSQQEATDWALRRGKFADDSASALVLTIRRWKDIQGTGQPVQADEIISASGINSANGELTTIVLLARKTTADAQSPEGPALSSQTR